MKDYLLKMIVKYLLDYLTKDKLEEFAKMVKDFVLPKLRMGKDELIALLRAEAQKSSNTIDDALVDALDQFLEAFMPDSATHL